jgi:DNA processing protein
MEALFYTLCLQQIPHLGPIKIAALIEQMGSAKNVLQFARQHQYYGCSALETRAAFNNRDALMQIAEAELAWARQNQIHVIGLEDPSYPLLLKQIPDAPSVIFVKGHLQPSGNHTIALVGTRRPSARANGQVKQILQALQQVQNTVVISGLAFGVDRMAHEQALSLKLPTWAIMGTGLNTVYPALHRNLAYTILDHGGAWVSEQGHKSELHPGIFPKRNRIISGLSEAVVVIESTCKGGSMITARLAQEYNREVFALCGRPDDSTASGCHALIKNHTAQLIESGQDIIQAMQWNKSVQNDNSSQRLPPVKFKTIWNLFLKQDCWTIEALYDTKVENAAAIAEALFYLESEYFIKSLPGARFQRI